MENHCLKMENEALRREAVPYARERLEVSYNYIEQQDTKLEELTIENKLLMRENSKAQSEVRRQTENTMQLMESRSYQMIQLKRDAECYSRYFSQVDDEYEGLRAQIRQLESAQRVAPQERTVVLMDDNSEFDEDTEDDEDIEDMEDNQDDQDAEDEFGDLFDFGDDSPLSSDEMDEFYDASEEPMDEAEEEDENRQ